MGKIYGKKVVYVRCGVGMVSQHYLFTPLDASSYVFLGTLRLKILSCISFLTLILVCFCLDQTNAAAATQQMLDLFNITGIVHFGVSGNLNDSMSIGDVTIPKQFADTGLWNWLVQVHKF